MRKLSRRRVLGSLGTVAAPFALGLGALRSAGGQRSRAPRQARPRILPGFPDPAREYHGYDSVGMEIAYGGADARRRLLGRSGNRVELRGAFDWAGAGEELRQSFDDLERHFIFEYYPWYGTDPWRHWTQWDRVPPDDVAATSYPALGPYSSRDTAVIEQHARWISQVGAGAVNISWWGQGSYSDGSVHQVMDVMADHGIKVMFHLEPYANDRAFDYTDDIQYLLQEFGDNRGWDTFLILRDADGSEGPVFKTFRTLVAPEVTDCHGITSPVADYTSDDDWMRQTDAARQRFREDFDHVRLLCDSMNYRRVRDAGFDGFAAYNNRVDPEEFADRAEKATRRDILFAFNCNPGFDSIARRNVADDSCYEAPPFHPPAELDWSLSADRERARSLAKKRIRKTLWSSIQVQRDPAFTNRGRGFFILFLNSFNEWHEGHAFEPAMRYKDLSAAQQAVGYHNAKRGDYRFRTLKRTMKKLLAT